MAMQQQQPAQIDPLEQQARTRARELRPLRCRRMAASPHTPERQVAETGV
jgi:hypothetical protein